MQKKIQERSYEAFIESSNRSNSCSTYGNAAAGSNFSGGTLTLVGVGGIAVGALISGLAVNEIGRKKRIKAAD